MKSQAEHEAFEVAPLSSEHEAYLIQRHGTVELEPIPSMDPNDPLNWSPLKKNLHLVLVAIHCMTATFMAAGIIPAYASMAKEYGTTLPQSSYFTSSMIMIYGILPLLWQPLMDKYGRRPFLTASALGATVFNIGGGFCKSYATQMVTRCFTAFFMSPVLSVTSAIVAEVFLSHERGQKNGIWTLLFTLGTPIGPLLMGFVEQHAGTRWIYWIFACMCFAIFLGWLLADETLYNRNRFFQAPQTKGEKVGAFFGVKADDSFLGFKSALSAKNDLELNVEYFLRPLKQFANYRLVVAAISYAIVFCYANIVLIVELPQYMEKLFGLDAQSTGLQFLSIIIGSAIGEILSGPLSDMWMKRAIKRRGFKLNEDRLWVSYNGYICVIFGLIIWGIKLEQAQPGHWTVTPLVGAAFAAGGNQIITTAIITYCIDLDYTRAPATGLFINLCRQIYGFIGPFYFPQMFASLGLGGSGGLLAGLVGVCAWLPVVIVHYIGWRRRPKTVSETPAASA